MGTETGAARAPPIPPPTRPCEQCTSTRSSSASSAPPTPSTPRPWPRRCCVTPALGASSCPRPASADPVLIAGQRPAPPRAAEQDVGRSGDHPADPRDAVHTGGVAGAHARAQLVVLSARRGELPALHAQRGGGLGHARGQRDRVEI